jgi:ubiquitin-protein ligase
VLGYHIGSSPKMSVMRNRIGHELRDIAKDPDPHFELCMTGDTVEEWAANVTGPEGSPYEARW